MNISGYLSSARNTNSKPLLNRRFLLLIGLLLTLLSDMRGSAGVFAWFMPVPFLIHVARYNRTKDRLWLLLVLVVASILTLAKTASDPLLVSLGFSVMSGGVSGLRYFIAYILWDYIRRRSRTAAGTIAFPAIIVCLEFLQAFYTPLGDWGVLANTQIANLTLLQTAALVGFTGISALMAWAAVLVALAVINDGAQGVRAQAGVFLTVFVALNVFGDLRLNQVPQGQYIRVAAIGTDYTFTGELPDPRDPATLEVTRKLIENTAKAARMGAVIAVWAEASTIVSQDGEQQLLTRLGRLARENAIEIVAAYVVLQPEGAPYHLQNKYSWITQNGDVAQTYRKHHPVPGEGSLPGTSPLTVLQTPYGKMAGAICYDFDFPRLGLAYARQGAELVVLPGLDWRGMLRRHSLMARLRAIEGGFPLIRAADGATSMAFDNRGRILASMPNFGNNDRVMLAYMPVGKTVTFYSRIGNLFAYLALLSLAVLLMNSLRNQRLPKHNRP